MGLARFDMAEPGDVGGASRRSVPAPTIGTPGSSGPLVVSIVAKSNTGKTTLIEGLLPELKKLGLRVGVLKHHHFLSSFDVPGKDTHRMAEAGADIVVGASPVQVAVFRRQDGTGSLGTLVAEYFGEMDLVLIEGYKRGPYPKIEVHRAARSEELICHEEELLALASDRPWPMSVPQFSLANTSGLAAFLGVWLQDVHTLGNCI